MSEAMYVLSVYRYVYDTRAVSLSFFFMTMRSLRRRFVVVLKPAVDTMYIHILMDNLPGEDEQP